MKAGAKRRGYLWEAAATLLFARLAVRFVHPRRLFDWAAKPPRRKCRFRDHEIEWIEWAIGVVLGAQRMRADRLSQAVAVQSMLKRRGIHGKLCLGVARVEEHWETNAWIEIDGRVIPDDVAGLGFVKLADYGGAPQTGAASP